MTETVPTSFKDIDPDVLRRQAVEDWAVDVKPTDSLKKVEKALEEAGVFWDDYAAHYGYVVENTLNEADTVAPVENVITAQAQSEAPVPATQIITAQAPVAQAEAKYLVKMERPNVSYQVGRYTFTKEHPYALIDGKDLEFVLRHEPGFRQAYPTEVAEFYQ